MVWPIVTTDTPVPHVRNGQTPLFGIAVPDAAGECWVRVDDPCIPTGPPTTPASVGCSQPPRGHSPQSRDAGPASGVWWVSRSFPRSPASLAAITNLEDEPPILLYFRLPTLDSEHDGSQGARIICGSREFSGRRFCEGSQPDEGGPLIMSSLSPRSDPLHPSSTTPRPALSRRAFRVLIIEDHALFAESLELALSMEGYDVRRVPLPEEGGSAAQLVAATTRLNPKVVLVDLDLGRFGDGARIIHPIARTGANVVVVTASPDEARWGECLRYGARKTLSKTRPLNEILAVVRRLHQGRPVLEAEERERLLLKWQQQREEQQEARERLAALTAREQEVLGQLMLGRPVREIARASVVSEATVRTQVKSILAKLDVSSQLAAVGLAHHAGWQAPGA